MQLQDHLNYKFACDQLDPAGNDLQLKNILGEYKYK